MRCDTHSYERLELESKETNEKLSLSFIAVLLFAVPLAAAPPDIWPAHDPIAGEYIVVFRNVTAPQVDRLADELARTHGGSVIVTLKRGVKGAGMRLTEEQARALAHNPNVDHVEENGRVFLSYDLQEFNDDSWWHLDRLDNRGPLYSYRAYAYTSTGSNVNAYILDTGVLGSHEQFGGRVTTGGTWADEYPANNPCGGFYDYYGPGHGTAVASVVGGNTNGVAKGVRIVPVKVWTCDAATGNMTSSILWWCWATDWILSDATSFANAGRRSVVNVSGGFIVPNVQNQTCNGTNCLAAFEHNINNLIANNVVVVAAANNFNNANCDTSPARMGYGGTAGFNTPHHTITVGGTTENDQRWVRLPGEEIPGSNDTGSNFGTCVDIYAPAQHFWHLAHLAGNSSYRTLLSQLSGTSFAAPVVTGVVARLLQTNPSWTPQQVWTYIRDNANHPTCFDPIPGGCRNDRLVYVSPYE